MCLALGFPHPDHLASTLTARQLIQWRAYDTVEPFGHVREDYRTAWAILHSLLPYTSKPLNVADYLPFKKADAPPPSADKELSANILSEFRARDKRTKTRE